MDVCVHHWWPTIDLKATHKERVQNRIRRYEYKSSDVQDNIYSLYKQQCSTEGKSKGKQHRFSWEMRHE